MSFNSNSLNYSPSLDLNHEDSFLDKFLQDIDPSTFSNIVLNGDIFSPHIKSEKNYDYLNCQWNLDFIKTPSLSTYKESRFGFQVVPIPHESEKSKYFYHPTFKKIYCNQYIYFPIKIILDEWPKQADISFIPVYKDSNHLKAPVTRCPQHQKEDETPNSNFIIQLSEDEASYKTIADRHFPITSLGLSDPGTNYKIFNVKSMCLSSCNGGPNRRPFVVLAVLWVNGVQVGRQIVEIKISKNPFRDMKNEIANEEKKLSKANNTVSEAPSENSSDIVIKNNDAMDTVKTESDESNKMVRIQVRAEYAPHIRRYVNNLIAKEIMSTDLLPFPEDGLATEIPFLTKKKKI